MTTPLLAFHGSSDIKTKYLNRVREHREADQLVQGVTWDKQSQKGCAIGCTLHGYSHSAYEEELGIPAVLAQLEDGIFEGLSVPDSREWPERFLSAIQPGADLSMVWPQFAHWLLVDPDHGAIRHAKAQSTRDAIQGVAALYSEWAAGKKPARERWLSARSAAYAADAADAADAAYAAYAAAYAAAADAADADAAYAAADAATAAADSAADSAAAADAYAATAAADSAARKARQAARRVQADKLVSLMSAAQILK